MERKLWKGETISFEGLRLGAPVGSLYLKRKEVSKVLMQVLRNDNDQYEIGQKLKARREELGLSQDDLGDRMGISRNKISHHENGDNEMGIGTFLQYADALQTQPQALLPARYESNGNTERMNQLTWVASQLSGDYLETLLKMAVNMRELQSKTHQIL